MVMFKVSFVFDIKTTAQFSVFNVTSILVLFGGNLLTRLFIDFMVLQPSFP